MYTQQLEKVRVAYHKSCQRELTALEKEKQANENTEMSPEKKQKITEAREKVTEEKEKVRRDVYTLHHPAPSQSCTLNLNEQVLIRDEINMLQFQETFLLACSL